MDTANWCFFFRAEVNKKNLKGQTFDEHWANRPAFDLVLELPVDLDIEDALEIARENGAPLGSRRSGIFEVQGPTGIWSHVNGRRMDFDTESKRAKVVFKSWEDLEAEELAEETARLVA